MLVQLLLQFVVTVFTLTVAFMVCTVIWAIVVIFVASVVEFVFQTLNSISTSYKEPKVIASLEVEICCCPRHSDEKVDFPGFDDDSDGSSLALPRTED